MDDDFPDNETLGGIYPTPYTLPLGVQLPGRPELTIRDSGVKGDLRSMTLAPGTTYQSNRCLGILGEAWNKFVEKNTIYGEPTDEDLGAKGQYADMHRKWKRIRRHLWDSEPWPADGESFEQVLMEFIGHLLLTIDFIREQKK